MDVKRDRLRQTRVSKGGIKERFDPELFGISFFHSTRETDTELGRSQILNRESTGSTLFFFFKFTFCVVCKRDMPVFLPLLAQLVQKHSNA